MPETRCHGSGAGTHRNLGRWMGTADPATLPVPGLFQMIQIAALDTYSHYPDAGAGMTPERVPVGHAPYSPRLGKGETQLIWGAFPETVRMEALESLPSLPEWLKDATDATEAEGIRWLEFCIQGWVQELKRT